MCNKKKRNHKRPQKPTKGTGSTRTFALFTSAMRIDSDCLPISYPPTPTLLCLSVPYSVLFFPLPLFSGLFFVDLSPAFFFFPFAYSIIPLQNATKKKKAAARTRCRGSSSCLPADCAQPIEMRVMRTGREVKKARSCSVSLFSADWTFECGHMHSQITKKVYRCRRPSFLASPLPSPFFLSALLSPSPSPPQIFFLIPFFIFCLFCYC